MALNKGKLQGDLASAFSAMRGEAEISDDKLAKMIAGAIDAYVKSGRVKVGITVKTTGTAEAQTGATTEEGIIY